VKFFRRTDLLVILGILVLSAVSWGVYSHAMASVRVRAEIYYYSELVETVDLKAGEERTLSVPQDDNVILRLYEDGSIAFVESDCPDKVCIHAGRLRTAGQFAACLPNGIVVKIVPQGARGDEAADLVI
jgi:hypothetical protein